MFVAGWMSTVVGACTDQFLWNFNGAADVAAAGSNTVFRVWVNDDGDVGDTTDEGGTDIPGQTGTDANCNDVAVNGRRDLPDFFPVMVDIGGVESVVGQTDISYRIKQAGDAVNVICTALTETSANLYLMQDARYYVGTAALDNLYTALVKPVTAGGVELEPGFLAAARGNNGKGVILVEGNGSSYELLVIKVAVRLCLRGGGRTL